MIMSPNLLLSVQNNKVEQNQDKKRSFNSRVGRYSYCDKDNSETSMPNIEAIHALDSSKDLIIKGEVQQHHVLNVVRDDEESDGPLDTISPKRKITDDLHDIIKIENLGQINKDIADNLNYGS